MPTMVDPANPTLCSVQASNTVPDENEMSQQLSASTDDQVARANASGHTPVVFIHGLWLLPSSWDRWAAVFEDAGYAALTPSWPDDPETVEGARAEPEVLANK